MDLPQGIVSKVWGTRRAEFVSVVLAIGVLFQLVSAATQDPVWAVAGLSALSFVLGLGVFLFDGGVHITASGCYGIGVAAFVGFPGLYLARSTDAPTLGLVISLSFFASAAILMLADPRAKAGRMPILDSGSSLASLLSGFLTILVGVGLWFVRVHGDIGAVLVFTGAVVVTVGAVLLNPKPTRWWLLVGIGLGCFYTCMAVFSSDGGRLRLASLGLAVAIIAVPRLPMRSGKWLFAALAVPAVMALAAERVRLDASYQANPNGSGLESAIAPIPMGAQLLDMFQQGLVPRYNGQTFLTSILAIVPRVVWPTKPLGWGAEIVQYINPELVGTTQSDAASLYVEAIVNFGFVIGVVLVIVAAVFLLRWLDRALVRFGEPNRADARLIAYVALVMAAAGLPELVWGGSFTYFARLELHLLALVAFAWPLMIGMRWISARARAKPASHTHEVVGPAS